MSKPVVKPKPASEIIKLIKKNREEIDRDIQEHLVKSEEIIYQDLREKFKTAITQMVEFGLYTDEVDLDEEELSVLERVTEEHRNLGYRFCLIERQKEDKTIIEHTMRISVAHLKEE